MTYVNGTVKSYTKKGKALTVLSDSKQAEVDGAIIGESVRIKLLKKRRKIFKSELVELLSKSPFRVLPKCPHYDQCGGCRFQHIDYDEQLKIKQKIIQKLFPDQLVNSIIKCENPWRYRSKMEFSFSQDKEGNRYLGLYQKMGRGKVENLFECHLTPLWFESILNSVRVWWEQSDLLAYHPPKDHGHLLSLTLRESKHKGGKLINLMVSGNARFGIANSKLESFKKAVLSCFSENEQKHISIYVTVRFIKKGEPTKHFEMHLHGLEAMEDKLPIFDKSYETIVSPASFSQPNPMQAQKLYEKAIELTNPQKEDALLDLFCGSGVISMAFSSFVKTCIGIELNPYSILDGQEAIKRNQLQNVKLIEGDAFVQLQALLQDQLHFSIVCIDPPRVGIGENVANLIKQVAPQKIVYISCNPYTQAEDIKHFLEEYKITFIQPIDQFPHTPHIENIVILQKI